MTEATTTPSARRMRITWIKSTIGYREQQRRVIRSLGLKRLRQTVEHYDTPSIRGMVNKVHHLVAVEPVEDGSPAPVRQTGSQRFAARLEARAAEYEEILNELLAEAEAYEAEQDELAAGRRASALASTAGASPDADGPAAVSEGAPESETAGARPNRRRGVAP